MKKQFLLSATILFSAGILFFTGCKKDDTTGPVITLNGSKTEKSILNAAYTDPSATAKDDNDGVVSVTSSGVVNKDLTGVYTITYSASDAAGNTTTETRSVTVYNEADYLVGTYATKDSVYVPLPPSVSSYTETITASTTVNNRLWVTKFGNYDNGKVSLDRVSATELTMTAQTVTCGKPGFVNSRIFTTSFPTGSGSIKGTGAASTTIKLDYKETVVSPASSANAISTWVKK
jgi:hypothetical protein